MNSTNVAQAPSKTLDSANVAFIAAGAEIVGVADEPAVGSGPAGAVGAGAVGAGAAILTMVKDKRLMIQEDGDSLIF